MTPGGLLRFRRTDIELLRTLESNDQAPVTTIDEVIALALLGDVDAAANIIVTAARRDAAVAPILETLIGPVLRETGDRWQSGRLSIAEEHIIANVLGAALIMARPHVRAECNVGFAGVLALGGDEHEMGARLAQLCLESVGFQCVLLGRGVPTNELIAWCVARAPDVIVCSVPVTLDAVRAEGELRAIATSVGPHTRVILGGAGAARLQEVHPRVDVLFSLWELEAVARTFRDGTAAVRGE